MTDFDMQGLRDWLRARLGGEGVVSEFEKFADGQSNPTYRATIDGSALVLRRKPFGRLLPSAHAIEREYRLLSALFPVAFPVAEPVALCEDAAVIGAPFYLMRFADGRNFTDGSLPGIGRDDRRGIYFAMADCLGALHSLDPEAIGLADFGRPGNYFARQVERWIRQYRTSQTDEIPEVERLIDWLPTTVPEQQGTSIIHGDYRIDNLIYGRASNEIVAVLDWELATLGDPLADLAYMAMNWTLPADGRAALDGLDLADLGIPSLGEMLERYCAASGRSSVPDLSWYFSFNLFRLVGILQGVKKRIEEGNASSGYAATVVKKIVPLARAALAQSERVAR